MDGLKNDRLIRALFNQTTDVTPIWIMRQAGRYLPEYRKLREQVKDFKTLYKTPELATEVTMQPIQRYPLDAAIIFSDILIVPEAMGIPLEFQKNIGPVFEYPITNNTEIENLRPVSAEEHFAWLTQSIKLVKNELNGKVPLIGFAGSPWTLAVYMIEGRGKSRFEKILTMLQKQDDILLHLLDKLAVAVAECLNTQIKAGAQCVMLFDTWGGILSTQQYQTFSLDFMEKVILNMQRDAKKVPCILFTKGGGNWLELMADSGCDALGIDWTLNIGEARQRVGDSVALQGNLNPAVLTESDTILQQETTKILRDFGHHTGHVFNLGHGITPDIHPDKVSVLIDTVHNFSYG